MTVLWTQCVGEVSSETRTKNIIISNKSERSTDLAKSCHFKLRTQRARTGLIGAFFSSMTNIVVRRLRDVEALVTVAWFFGVVIICAGGCDQV